MELNALKKNVKPSGGDAPASVTQVEERARTVVYTDTLTIQYNTLLHSTIRAMLDAMHTGQDFTYVSVSDVIRAALLAYKDGMDLTELDVKGTKQYVTLRVNEPLKAFYNSFPQRMRYRIVERAVRTFLKNQ